MRLYRTSVKDDLNVGSVFQHLAENYVNKVSLIMFQLPFGIIESVYCQLARAWAGLVENLTIFYTFIRKCKISSEFFVKK